MQSQVLVWLVGLPVLAMAAPLLLLMAHPHNAGYWALRAGMVALTFGLLVWALRAATPAAAFFGAAICLAVTFYSERPLSPPELHSGLAPLTLLFMLTFAAGRLARASSMARLLHPGKAKKTRKAQETDAARHGRNAAQVLANLGVAALAVAPFSAFPTEVSRTMLLAALAEATADTLSSEIGSAFGGTPVLLTTLQKVEPGTDGGISLIGTIAGSLGAAMVVLAGAWAMQLAPRPAVAAFTGAIAGLFFDSLLGATLERRGWLGNDWVNFLSTALSAVLALAL